MGQAAGRATGRSAGEVSAQSTWAPLRNPVYRSLWLAVLVSNVGTWMQTVGAQWLLVDAPNAETLVALVQTASMLPVLLLALPSGVLADTLDRRRLLIGVQVFQVAVGGVLTVLTAVDRMPPALLLTLTFALGAGAALTVPAWQAMIPDLVPRVQLPAASALGAVSVNLARALGPAVAGVLVAQVGVAAVFALNALSFGVFAVALLAWRPGGPDDDGEPERFAEALRAGGRYVRHSPVVRRILLRVTLFIVPATALWALLPLVASRRLALGAGGYGLLLGALGVGAVAGAVGLPRIRQRFSTNLLLLVASGAYAAALAVLALVRIPWLVLLALVPAGVAWIAVLASVNAALQLFLPGWVRARGLSVYQVITFGGQAAAAAVWGVCAQRFGVPAALLAAGSVLAVGALAAARWPLIDAGRLNREPAVYWPEPHLITDPDPREGPVLVQVAYTVRVERADEFVAAMEYVRRSRQRTGATRWGLFRDVAAADRFVEVYLVPSWDEHLRQHGGRLTGSDREREEVARELVEGDPVVEHLLPARPR
jgi:MFS family permease